MKVLNQKETNKYTCSVLVVGLNFSPTLLGFSLSQTVLIFCPCFLSHFTRNTLYYMLLVEKQFRQLQADCVIRMNSNKYDLFPVYTSYNCAKYELG